MKRSQNGEMAPPGLATVLNGQRSMIYIVSVMLRTVGASAALRRAAIEGIKTSANVFWASACVLLYGGLFLKASQVRGSSLRQYDSNQYNTKRKAGIWG